MKKEPGKLYKLFFRLEIKSNNGAQTAEQVFEITIPARGFFFAKKKLERFVIANLNVEVVDFETRTDDKSIPDVEWEIPEE